MIYRDTKTKRFVSESTYNRSQAQGGRRYKRDVETLHAIQNAAVQRKQEKIMAEKIAEDKRKKYKEAPDEYEDFDEFGEEDQYSELAG